MYLCGCRIHSDRNLTSKTTDSWQLSPFMNIFFKFYFNHLFLFLSFLIFFKCEGLRKGCLDKRDANACPVFDMTKNIHLATCTRKDGRGYSRESKNIKQDTPFCE